MCVCVCVFVNVAVYVEGARVYVCSEKRHTQQQKSLMTTTKKEHATVQRIGDRRVSSLVPTHYFSVGGCVCVLLNNPCR